MIHFFIIFQAATPRSAMNNVAGSTFYVLASSQQVNLSFAFKFVY